MYVNEAPPTLKEDPKSSGYSIQAQVPDPTKTVLKVKTLTVEPFLSYSIETPRDDDNPADRVSKRRNSEVVTLEATHEMDQKALFTFQQGCALGHTPAETIAQMIKDAKDTETVQAVHRLTRTLSST